MVMLQVPRVSGYRKADAVKVLEDLKWDWFDPLGGGVLIVEEAILESDPDIYPTLGCKAGVLGSSVPLAHGKMTARNPPQSWS